MNEEQENLEKLNKRLGRIEEAIRHLAKNHQRYISRRGHNGAPDTTQEYVDNFWINKIDEILRG